MRMTGSAGQLRVGGRVAANLQRWSYDGTPEAWSVEAETADIDEFWFDTDRVFELRLMVGDGVWSWQDVTVKGRSRVTIKGEGVPRR